MKKALEIRVNDNIEVFDTLVEALHYITEEIKRWFENDDNRPFSVFIKRNETRGPPLKINVHDGIGARGGLV